MFWRPDYQGIVKFIFDFQPLLAAFLALSGGYFILRAAKIQSNTEAIRLNIELEISAKAFKHQIRYDLREYISISSILIQEIQETIESDNLFMASRRLMGSYESPHIPSLMQDRSAFPPTIGSELLKLVIELIHYDRKIAELSVKARSSLPAGPDRQFRLALPGMTSDLDQIRDNFSFLLAALESAVDVAKKICTMIDQELQNNETL